MIYSCGYYDVQGLFWILLIILEHGLHHQISCKLCSLFCGENISYRIPLAILLHYEGCIYTVNVTQDLQMASSTLRGF